MFILATYMKWGKNQFMTANSTFTAILIIDRERKKKTGNWKEMEVMKMREFIIAKCGYPASYIYQKTIFFYK